MRTKLRPDETLALVIHKHWIVMLQPMLAALLLAVGAGFAYWNAMAVLGHALAALAGVPLAVVGWKFLDRSVNLWAVTDQRVIDERGVFSLYSKECSLEKIHNVSYEQSLLGRLFGYGSVEIQTAAEMGATVERFIENPRLFKDTITERQEGYRRRLHAPSDAAPVGETRECPYCAETIKARAKVCRFCSRELS